MDDDDDIIVLASSLAAATLVLFYEDEEASKTFPLPRFLRPSVSYMEFLAIQYVLLSDQGERIIRDTFRLGVQELNQLASLCKTYLPRSICAKNVICVALHWLASGSSVRAQEQFFLDHGLSKIHHYRHIGVDAIIKSLVMNGFYGTSAHEPNRIEISRMAFAEREPSLFGCISAIDGTHTLVVVNRELADQYRNRKGQTSTNVLGVVDYNGMFIAVYPGAEGCASDGFAFGVLKRKWTILLKPIEAELDTINKIIYACCALHNYALSCNAINKSYFDGIDIDEVDEDESNDESRKLLSELLDLRDISEVSANRWRQSIAEDMWNAYTMYNHIDNE
ncbi:hypothetical protein AC1031_018796 [Aphanomyces cochlioides]|nr:hypothetical protein AC1031_018796 [Aphanomyces cochlioides]